MSCVRSLCASHCFELDKCIGQIKLFESIHQVATLGFGLLMILIVDGSVVDNLQLHALSCVDK